MEYESSDTDFITETDHEDSDIENHQTHVPAMPSESTTPSQPTIPSHPTRPNQPAMPFQPIDANATDATVTDNNKRGRKRARNPDNWKRNRRSMDHNSGRNKRLRGCCNCKKECESKFTAEYRNQLFSEFWGLNCKKRRRDFVISHVERKDVVRRRAQSTTNKRKYSLNYALPQQNGPKTSVCKVFFLNTFDISESVVKYNLNQKEAIAVSAPAPKVPHNKTSDKVLDCVRSHINSFPKIESHFCRRTTSRQFLEAGLSISEMFRLYKKSAEERGETNLVNESVCRKIFNGEFNLSFHTRKKDQCDTCDTFYLKDKAGTITEEDKTAQEEHLNRKLQARESKDRDKLPSNSVASAVFDLQQVMTCPKLNVGTAYYLRKINVYNLTVYELQTRKGICNVWTEAEHNRGTNEVASCIIKWLERKDEEGYQHVILYSDTCGGQNRNKIMCTALMWFLTTQAKNLTMIEQKFFESGHSQNEGDSMHACIQREFTHKDIYLPTGYYQSMKDAIKRKDQKYVVVQMRDHVQNFDELNRQTFKSNAFAGIQSIHHIVYQKFPEDTERVTTGANGQFPRDGRILFSKEIGGPLEIREFIQRGKILTGKVVSAVKPADKIDALKKKDLLKLVGHLPFDCRAFYQNL